MESRDSQIGEGVCGEELPCGHNCDYFCQPDDPRHIVRPCRQACQKNCSNGTHPCPGNHSCGTECPPCQAPTYPLLVCGHMPEVPCYQDLAEIHCTEQYYTNAMLSCGHLQLKKCGEDFSCCNVPVQKVYSVCGHTVEIPCYQFWITQACNTMVLTKKQPKCGHPRLVPCHKVKEVDEDGNDPVTCNEKCTDAPAGSGCGHNCPGDCSTCFQKRFHRRCDRTCNRNYLYCSHRCMYTCSKDCPPCGQKCEFFCDHGRCEKLCYVPCDPCQEPCSAKCEHFACTKLCSEPCDRDPCSFPCSKKLQCGHMCIGYCGETCPPLCRVCDQVKIGGNFVLEEDLSPDTRFIYIEGCQHTVDNETLTAWMNYLCTEKELEIPSCPICRVPIFYMKRFSHFMAQKFWEITAFKLKQNGNVDENAHNIAELMLQLTNIGQPEPLFESTRHFLLDTILKSFNLFFRERITCMQWTVKALDTAESVMKDFKENLNTVMLEHLATLHNNFFDMIKSRPMPFGKLEVDSLLREIARLELTADLLRRVTRARNVELLLYTAGTVEARKAFREAYTLVVNRRYFGEDDESKVRSLIQDIDMELLIITEKERREIVETSGMFAGTLCHRGVSFIVNERVESVEIGKCTLCPEHIDEGNQLLQITRVAPEIQDMLLPLLE